MSAIARRATGRWVQGAGAARADRGRRRRGAGGGRGEQPGEGPPRVGEALPAPDPEAALHGDCGERPGWVDCRPSRNLVANGEISPIPDLHALTPRNEEVRPIETACDARTFSECRAFLARRCGVRSLRSGSGRKGRNDALKTDWINRGTVGASYGDRMAPVMVSRRSRAGRS